MTRAGTPIASAPSGTSELTTLPAATTAPRPIVTPFCTRAPVPIQTWSPIVTGRMSSARSGSWRRRRSRSAGCPSESAMEAPLAMPTCCPTITRWFTVNDVRKPMVVPWPMRSSGSSQNRPERTRIFDSVQSSPTWMLQWPGCTAAR